MIKFVNYEKIVTDLKSSVDVLIEDLNSLQKNYISDMDGSLKSENALLREKLNNLENNTKSNPDKTFVKRFEKSSFPETTTDNIDFDFIKKTNNFFSKLDKNIKKILEHISTDNYSLITSYRNIFENGKFIYNNFLDEFLHKNFFVGKNKNYDKLNQKLNPDYLSEQNKIIDLKNGFIKLTMIMSFYENIIFDSLSKINIDISRFQIQERYQEQSQAKINDLHSVFVLYSELLEDLNNLRQSEKLDFNLTHMNMDGDKSIFVENNLLKSYHKNSKNIRKVVNINKHKNNLTNNNSNGNLFGLFHGNIKKEDLLLTQGNNITINNTNFYQSSCYK